MYQVIELELILLFYWTFYWLIVILVIWFPTFHSYKNFQNFKLGLQLHVNYLFFKTLIITHFGQGLVPKLWTKPCLIEHLEHLRAPNSQSGKLSLRVLPFDSLTFLHYVGVCLCSFALIHISTFFMTQFWRKPLASFDLRH